MGHVDLHVPWSLYESIIWKVHKMIFVVARLWGKWCEPSPLGIKLLYILPQYLISFIIWERCTTSKGWQALDVEAIVVELLHDLWVPWPVYMFCCCFCFNASNVLCVIFGCDMIQIWLMRYTIWKNATIMRWILCYILFMSTSWLVDTLFASTCTWGA